MARHAGLPLVLALCLAAGPVLAAPTACEVPGPGIAVETAGAPDAAALCTMAADALAQLSACGLSQTRPVTLAVSPCLPAGGPGCLGAFHGATDRIELLEPGALAAGLGPNHPYGAIPPESLFASLLVHEMAHALVHQTRGAADPSHVTDEYVAYAMQLASLPEEERAALLSALPGAGAAEPAMLNAFILGFAPTIFAAAAWRHFAADGGGCAFVSALVAGEAALPGAGLCPDPLSCPE